MKRNMNKTTDTQDNDDTHEEECANVCSCFLLFFWMAYLMAILQMFQEEVKNTTNHIEVICHGLHLCL